MYKRQVYGFAVRQKTGIWNYESSTFLPAVLKQWQQDRQQGLLVTPILDGSYYKKDYPIFALQEQFEADLRRICDTTYLKRYEHCLLYTSSLEPTYRIIFNYISFVMLCGLVVVGVAYIFGRTMAKRILEPVQELVRVTEEVAQGNYKVTAIKYHNDEIGQLVDARCV